MEYLLPFLQSLVWPAFLGILVYSLRNWLLEFLEVIKRRVKEGGRLEVGPRGFVLESAPRLPDDPGPDEIIDDGETTEISTEFVEREKAIKKKDVTDPLESLQLVHRTKFSRVKNGRDYYRIVVSLGGAVPEALSKVKRVIYYLHHTFKNPVRQVEDASKKFSLKTAAWGEFTIRADVYLNDRAEPIRLSRYINIEPREA